jgi:hypothetical protein
MLVEVDRIPIAAVAVTVLVAVGGDGNDDDGATVAVTILNIDDNRSVIVMNVQSVNRRVHVHALHVVVVGGGGGDVS